MLASWLFAQYLLTNDVQIAYAQTEGYVPVTRKAQQSDAYQDYLSRAGEDNELHYSVKLEATKLLLESTGSTFVTPVFNGSASLRNAAGQLVEDVNKSVRRGETLDSRYISRLYKEVSSLYRLDQIRTDPGAAPGEIPAASKALLTALALCWLAMGGYVLKDKIRKHS